MTLKGLISPPRSRSSPRESRPYNNAAAHPPSRPNYMSPTRRRPTAADHHTHRKPTANATREAKKSPPRIRPAAPIVPSRRPNPNDLQNQKKLDNNSSSKTTAKVTSSRPSSPRTQQPKLRRNNNGVEQPRGPTLNSKNSTPKPKGAVASGSRSDSPAANANSANLIAQKYFDSRKNNPPNHFPSHGSGHGQQDVKNIGNNGNQNRYSGGSYTSLGDPEVNTQLQQLSIDDKDLANIVLHANSIYESVGSDTKEECSSQNNGPRIFQIYKDIASQRQGNSSITSYFTKLKTLWDELTTYSDVPQCSCSAMEKVSEHVEREKVMQFLVGLNDSYSTICLQIFLIQPFPTVEKAYSVIIREEKRRELVLSLEMVAAKVMQNKWLLQNDQLGNGEGRIEEVDNNVEEQKLDQNESDTTMPPSIYNLEDVEIPSFPNEPLLIDLGSPVRC